MATAISTRDRCILVTWLGSLFLLFVLFSLDEGKVSFQWMSDIGSWFVFLIYTAVITTLQVLTEQFIYRPISKGWTRAVLSAATGLVGGLVITFYLFS